MDPADVAELLEEAERNAAAKDRARAEEAERALLHSDSHSDPRGRRHGRDSNNNRYSAEREQNDQRRSRRSKDLADDEDVRDGSDTLSANGSNRSRRRSRSPDRDRHSSRDHHGHRDRGRNDRGGDFYRGGGRMSRQDDDHYRPGSDDRRYRERSPRGRDDRGDRDRSGRDRYRSGDGPPRRVRTPEQSTADKDNRLVFVQQLAGRLRTHQLKEFFEQCGPVVEAQIVKDRITHRSKGVGYVEFEKEESVEKALALTGQKLLSIPVIVQHAEADKNRQSRKTEGSTSHSSGVPFHRLYVGNIHFSLSEDDLKTVFSPFGELEFVQLQKEEGGRSKGYGFVQFVDPTQAKDALENLNGFELAGRQIRVGLGNDKFTPESTQNLLQNFGSQAQQATFQGSAFSGSGGRGAHAGGTTNFDRASGRDADRTAASALDDTDVAGVNFSNYSRDALMRKLARTDEPEPKITPNVQPQRPAPIQELAPTRNVLIKNVYTQAMQTEPRWEEELRADMQEECEAKYGKVKHIGISLNSDEGEVFIKFNDKKSGENAIRGLNGRWFDGRMLSASYVADAFYNSNFPKAAAL